MSDKEKLEKKPKTEKEIHKEDLKNVNGGKAVTIDETPKNPDNIPYLI